MREHLVFLLAAPMASCGSYAGHERRGSELVPMRSAVLGLLGAALGIDRADADGQDALRAYRVAVQPFQRSVPLRDYHTVQTVQTARAKRPPTRREALRRVGREANTLITYRDYRCDVMVGAALWDGVRWGLDVLADRLRRPKFPLYFGRKSCPLATPLDPRVVMAAGPAEALAQIAIPAWLRTGRRSESEPWRSDVFSDPLDGGSPPQMSERMPSEPIDRKAWTFAEHTVWRLEDHRGEPDGDGEAA